MRGKYNFSSARTLRYHPAVRCHCWVLISVPDRDDLPWLPLAPSWGFDSHAPYSLQCCLHLQRKDTTWRTISYKYLFSAHIEQTAFIRHTLMDGIPVVGCGWLWRLRMDKWTVLPSLAPKWVPIISSWKWSSYWSSPALMGMILSRGHSTGIFHAGHWHSRGCKGRLDQLC